MQPEHQKTDTWTKVVAFFLWSSPFFTSRIGLFASLALGGSILVDPRVVFNRWFKALTQNDPLTGFAWPVLISLLYGIAQMVYGYLLGHALVTIAEIFVFNLCPFVVFLGIWVGMRDPTIVRRYVRYMAWFSAIYSLLYFLFLGKLNVFFPGSTDPLFYAPGTGSVLLLGLLAFEPKLLKFWFPIMMLAFNTIAGQQRADWLGLCVALVIWGTATRKLGRVFGMAGLIATLLLVGYVTDFSLPPIPGRGGEISARETVARAVAAVSPETAHELGSSTNNANFYKGTVDWRTRWWAGIRDAVSEHYSTMIFGLGYGYPLAELAGPTMKGSDTRTPHSIFYFALAYSGAIGVLVFLWLQFAIVRLLWLTFKTTGQIYGLAYYSAVLTWSFFGNWLEAPQAGIPTYLMVGLCLGPFFLGTADFGEYSLVSDPGSMVDTTGTELSTSF